MNKRLLIISALLVPITIISFFKKETNFIMEENNNEIYVNVVYNSKVINIPLEEYVIGVVAAEMPALFEEEALKAQAVAARTYAIATLNEKRELTSTIEDQVYISRKEMIEKWQDNHEKYFNKIKDAVLSTKNIIIKYNGTPIKAYYYSKSNGYTANSETVFNIKEDYLEVIESIDKDNYYEKKLSKVEFCSKLNIQCNDIHITNELRDDSNRVQEITINNKTFQGTEIRNLLSLKSTDFTIEQSDIITITTNGYGHGVGMSQYGANLMAKEGKKYKEILNHYYKNIQIEEI